MQSLDPKYLAMLDRMRAQAAERRAAKEAALAKAAKAPAVSLTLPTSVAQEILAAAVAPVEIVEAAVVSDTRPQPSAEQLAFVEAVLDPAIKLLILIGAAGTGKTFAEGLALEAMLERLALPGISWDSHKHLPATSAGIVFCAFTRRATDNIRKKLPKDFSKNCVTIHKLLEYMPEYFDVLDPKTGIMKKSMRFVPARNKLRKLPAGLQYLFIDEFSMLGSELFEKLLDALSPGVKIIFIGDIYQLTPVMDFPAIAPFLLQEKTIELTHVYRQALDNPIIEYATKIRMGEVFMVKENTEITGPNNTGKLTLHPWKKRCTPELAVQQLGMFFAQELAAENYDPKEDQILVPYNVGVGTIELNKFIATAYAQMLRLPVWEVIAGFEKRYFRIGDACVYDKSDCEILDIQFNYQFAGNKLPQDPSTDMDYWGNTKFGKRSQAVLDSDAVDRLLDMGASSSEERKTQASHIIKLRMEESGIEFTVSAAGEVNKLDLRYVQTIHKAQGSEWRKVYLCLHHTHTTLKREGLYTGFTRAREELYVICETDSFIKSVARQEIPGNTLEEKAKKLKMKAMLRASCRTPSEEE